MDSLQQRLVSGAELMGLSLPDKQVETLMAYLALLQKWNKAYNLTAIRNPSEMVEKHLLDSLSVTDYIGDTNLLDVGTGPGLPGMIMAIMHPTVDVTLLDSNGKKTRFLHQAKTELGLDNVTVIHGRVEALPAEKRYDQITSRAFASINDMLTWTGHLVSENGRFLAMKGVYPHEELAEMPQSYTLESAHPLKVPEDLGERHLMIIKKN